MMTEEEKKEVEDMINSAFRKHLTPEKEGDYELLNNIEQEVQEICNLDDPGDINNLVQETQENLIENREAFLIAVAGSKPGAGATHHAVLIAKTQAEKVKKVALLDMSETKDLSEGENEQPKEVDLIRNATILQLDKIIYAYDVIVIDMGHYCDEIKNLFTRCDQKIIVCGGSTWDMRYLLPVFSDVKDDYIFFFNHVFSEERKQSILSGMIPLKIMFSEYTPEVLTYGYPDPFDVMKKGKQDQTKRRWRG